MKRALQSHLRIFCGFLLCGVFPALCAVRVWQDSFLLPTYEELAPDLNPPFHAFAPGDPVMYPYSMRTGFTKNRGVHAWRALRLENEYLNCIVLPDLGGHLYSCKDKLSGQEMFHANSSVKKAAIGLRGAWVAMGIELNFPVGHSWMSVSPVDFATTQNADGSASIWVGNVDRVYGMEWRVEFVLHPESAVLEQNVHLYNRSAIRRRYYWWNTAGIARVDDKTRFIYPTRLTGTHGLTEIDSWPVNSAGIDMSVVGNHKGGGLGLFAHGSREPFMAVYHPSLRTGTVHYADAKQVPGKKLWSWGIEGDKFARKELSDNDASYVEMQAGLFENQETFGFLEPGESRKFTEYWMPLRGLGGVSRANLTGVLNLERRRPDANGQIQLAVEFNANHKIPGAKLRVTNGPMAVLEESADLDPAVTFAKTVNGLPKDGHYTFQLVDSMGQVLLTHVEDQYDAVKPKEVNLGPQPKQDLSTEKLKTVADFLRLGQHNELQGLPGSARYNYQEGLKHFPEDMDLNRALGRLAVGENRFDEAVNALTRAQAHAPNDPEVHYYLGLAYAALGDDGKARKEWEAVKPLQSLHAAAAVALAGVLARAGDRKGALELVRNALVERPDMIRAGAMEVALLRHLGETGQAGKQLSDLRSLDPADASLRYEQYKLGAEDALLWPHLGADPERVLNVAIGYLELGLYDDALDLLSRTYPPPPDSMATEPAAVLPRQYPLIGYYRGYAKMQLGQSGRQDLEEASAQSTEYVWPNRPSEFTVLRAALKENPSDGTALFLLGELYLSSGEVDQAIDAWQRARSLGSRRPELYRTLGRALLELKKDRGMARDVYQDGARIAPLDPEIRKNILALVTTSIPAPTPTASGSSTSTDFAGLALELLADGKQKEAAAVFNTANFPAEKQDTFVREAYIEVQARSMLALAGAKRCEEAIAAEDHLGDENPALPFTFHSFGTIVKGARIQHYFALVEAACGNQRGARKAWSKLAKSSRDVSDPDFTIPLQAAARVDPDAEVKPRVEAALQQIKNALTNATDRVTLLYSQGVLLRLLGRENDALASFTEALRDTRPAIGAYLARLALGNR